MRTVSDLGWDGPANLFEAVRVAASPETRGFGVMVVIGGQIFAALDTTKTNTHLLDAFESPGLGPLGVLDEGELILRREMPPSPPIIRPNALATPIDIIFAAAGSDARLLDASQRASARARPRGDGTRQCSTRDGPRNSTLGRGWEAGGAYLAHAGRRVGHTYGYPGGGRRLEEMGAIFGGSRRAQQARIDLMLALGAGMNDAEIRIMFDS